MSKLKSWLFSPVRTRMIREFYSPESDEWIRIHIQESRFDILIHDVLPTVLVIAASLVTMIMLLSVATLLIRTALR